MSTFVQVRRDLVDLVPAPEERRTSRLLATLALAMMVLLEADWRSGEIAPWLMVAWGKAVSMPWRRVRLSADRLIGHELAEVRCTPFVGSWARIERDRLVHQRANTEERFVQVSPAAVGAMRAEHHLTWKQLGVLLALVLIADDRDWVVRGWTLKSLGDHLGTGHRTLRAILDRLAEAGLVEWAPHRGAHVSLAVPGAVAIVVGGVPPAGPKQHRERRQLAREAARDEGAPAALARHLLARLSLEGAPSATLVTELGELLGHTDATTIEAQLVAGGTLAGSASPMGALVARVRRLGPHLVAVAADAVAEHQRRQEAHEAGEAALKAERAERDARELERADQEGESRWLAGVLDDATLLELTGRCLVARPSLGAQILPASIRAASMATAITEAARAALASAPGLEPAQAVRAGTAAHLGTEAGDAPAGDAPAGDAGAPPPGRASLPRSRDGPTLAERIRDL